MTASNPVLSRSAWWAGRRRRAGRDCEVGACVGDDLGPHGNSLGPRGPELSAELVGDRSGVDRLAAGRQIRDCLVDGLPLLSIVDVTGCRCHCPAGRIELRISSSRTGDDWLISSWACTVPVAVWIVRAGSGPDMAP
jgi:hypothetical protein